MIACTGREPIPLIIEGGLNTFVEDRENVGIAAAAGVRGDLRPEVVQLVARALAFVGGVDRVLAVVPRASETTVAAVVLGIAPEKISLRY